MNGKVLLECNVSSNPLSTIIWYHDGKPIETNISSSKKNEQASHLTVNIDSNSKFGAYKCQANNTLGSDEKVITLLEERKYIFCSDFYSE